MNVAVAGLWHLGSVTAACLASSGIVVTGFDEDQARIAGFRNGMAPLAEPGLNELIRAGIQSGRLVFSSDPGALADASMLWVTYDTPVNSNDQADVEGVVTRIQELLPHLTVGTLVLVSSQLPVGSVARLERFAATQCPQGQLTFACSPENLRLGKAIECFLKPDRVIVGVRHDSDRARLQALLSPFTPEPVWMSVESAEVTKHAINAFLASSVAFINELAVLCEKYGADAKEVERGLKSEQRIGPKAYVGPGAAFAGGTLARDIQFLIELGQNANLPTPFFAGVLQSNEQHKSWPRRRLGELLGKLRGATVAVLGLTYKPGTSTLRRSSAVELCRWLVDQGTVVRGFDPAILLTPAESEAHCITGVTLCQTPEQALRGANAAVIATEWPEFKSLAAGDVLEWMDEPVVLDAGRFLGATLGKDSKIRYQAVGKA